jgi:Raf kinase inhibitor-like YbhB/YbcL family protein
MVRQFLVVLAAVFAMSACGSSSSSSSSNRPGSSAATTTTAFTGTSAPTTGAAEQPALTSAAFADGADIPRKYACVAQGGTNASPPLAWTGFPTNGVRLVLVVHDPDAPIPGGFTHLVTTIPPATTRVADGANASDGPMNAWRGPCPPSGTHHYEFTLYAFGSDVNLPSPLDKKGIDAIAGKAKASAKLTGLFTSSR